VCLSLTIDYKTRRGQTCVLLLDVANLWRRNILAATPTCFMTAVPIIVPTNFKILADHVYS
jgi:hypothetical protein